MFIELLKNSEFLKVEKLIVEHYGKGVKALTIANLKDSGHFVYDIYNGTYFNFYMTGIINHPAHKIEWYLCVNENNGYVLSLAESECLQHLFEKLKERDNNE